ncbi:hypothetical protein MRY87_09010 [bacterium]|nr:hypothetical protein [bacterium]
MIHTLEVSVGQEVRLVEKEARKLAMTGGYEVQLAEGLTQEELEEIFVRWSGRWREQGTKYGQGSASHRATISARILALLESSPNISPKLRDQVAALTDI